MDVWNEIFKSLSALFIALMVAPALFFLRFLTLSQTLMLERLIIYAFMAYMVFLFLRSTGMKTEYALAFSFLFSLVLTNFVLIPALLVLSFIILFKINPWLAIVGFLVSLLDPIFAIVFAGAAFLILEGWEKLR